MTNMKSLRELEQIQNNLEYQNEKLRAFIADIVPPDIDSKKELKCRLEELENLVNTFWWVVIVSRLQKRQIPDYKSYIWSWKLDEIITEMKEKKANLLIIWNILKPIQIYNINEKLKFIWAKAWDRIDLILKIFERNAKTKESHLQIELASIKHMWPRIFSMSQELWSQGSWWSKLSRWKWETNTSIMKTHLKKREESIKKELEHFKKVRLEHRKSRQRKWLNTVWIVWYTNAGKSSLFNLLTNKKVLVEDKLFATLWTSVGKIILMPEIKKDWTYQKPKEILLNDTIWFIRDLPPELIQAFASTLEDSIESDLLIHLIDASDEKCEEKIKVVDDILDRIEANQKKIYVFNKADLLKWEDLEKLQKKFSYLNPIFISVQNWYNIEELKKVLISNF